MLYIILYVIHVILRNMYSVHSVQCTMYSVRRTMHADMHYCVSYACAMHNFTTVELMHIGVG